MAKKPKTSQSSDKKQSKLDQIIDKIPPEALENFRQANKQALLGVQNIIQNLLDEAVQATDKAIERKLKKK